MRAIALLLIPSLMSGAAAPVAAQSAPDPIASVRAFVAQFQRDAPSLVAHEDYVQNATYGTRSGQHQVTTAELVMGPSIIRNVEGRDLLARGRVWAEAETGAVVRTELLLEDRMSSGSCTVDFGIDPRLGIRVPIKMTERYRMTGETIDAVARYSDFRSFTVSTTEKVGKPPGR